MANENNLLRPPVFNQDDVGIEKQARQQQRQAQRQLVHQQNRGMATIEQLTALVSTTGPAYSANCKQPRAGV